MGRMKAKAALIVALLVLQASALMLNVCHAGTQWIILTVDSAGDVGQYSSLALDSNGYTCISYVDYTYLNYGALKFARWNGSAWITATVDSAGNVGGYSSLALDSSGYPCISYYDSTNHALKFARWNGTAWINAVVDSAGDVGMHCSLALNSAGNPCISYFDYTMGELKFARWTGSEWSTEVVDFSAGYADTSLAFDSSGYPCISYYDATPNHALKFTRWTGAAWINAVVDSAGDVGRYSSLAMDLSGYPCISYYDSTNHALKFARWNGTAWINAVVDSAGDVGRYSSLAMDLSGYPCISYYDDYPNYDLKFARWTGSAWITATVDSAGNVGRFTSLAFNSFGSPCISYYDATLGDLKFTWGQAAPPTGWIVIYYGFPYTSYSSIGLTLSYTAYGASVSQVRYSNDGATWTDWEAPTPQKAWTLTSGDGTKTVYYQIKDSDGMLSASLYDTILLDTTAPQGSVQIINGAAYTNKTSVSLALSATDTGSGVFQMCFQNDGGSWSSWEPYATSKSWTLNSGDGAKTVYVQYMDHAGLTVTSYDMIVLDTTLPVANAGQNQNAQVGQVVTFNGAGSTDNNGIASYQWNFGDGGTGSGVSPSHSYSSVGTYTVSLMVTDVAGNSAASSSTVSVEVVVPEFPSSGVMMLLLMCVSVFALAFKGKRRLGRQGLYVE